MILEIESEDRVERWYETRKFRYHWKKLGFGEERSRKTKKIRILVGRAWPKEKGHSRENADVTRNQMQGGDLSNSRCGGEVEKSNGGGVCVGWVLLG